jgi:hypothetical protein
MLSFCDRDPQLGRRCFLQAGALAGTGFGLPSVLHAAASQQSVLRDRAVIFLFLHGGPSQTETFDPKMTAPVGIQSATGELQTKIPGVTFGGTFPLLAERADRFTIVRSFVTGDGNHDIKPVLGRHSLDANLGSLYSRVAGTNRTGTGIPTNIALFPQAVQPDAQPFVKSFGDFTSAGKLGEAIGRSCPAAPGKLRRTCSCIWTARDWMIACALLDQLDGLRRSVDRSGTLAGHGQGSSAGL